MCDRDLCWEECLLFYDFGLENKLITYGSRNEVLPAVNGNVKGHTRWVRRGGGR